MYSLIQSVIRIFKSLYGIHVNNIPVIIISDDQHEFENEFDIICGVNARAAFNVFVRCNILNINEQIRISNSINRRIYSFDVNIRDITYVVQGMAPISYFGSSDIIRIIYNNIDEHFATVTEFETYVRTHLISYPEKHIFFTNYIIRRMLNYIIGCIIILIATIAALIGQSIGTISGGLDEFQTDALKQYPELKIKKPLPTFEEFCYPKNYAVQKQQKFAAEYMKKSKSRELLVFHKIGAGKTCLAIQIGERFKSKGRILVIMPASLIPGFRNELRSDCAGYITNKDRDKLKKFQPGSIEYKKIIAKSDEHIDEIWQIYSYNKFATSNEEIIAPLIIVDEVQNLSGQGFFYKSILSWIDLNPTARVVIMSGTPLFNSLNEIYPIAKLLRINQDSTQDNELFITPENIKDLFAGKVSYFNGAPDYTFPKSLIKIKKCMMSKFQSRWYLAQVEAEMAQTGRIKLIEVSDNFYIKSRQRSNIVYPNGLTDQDGLDALSPSIIRLSLDVYSCKYAALIKKLRKNMLSFVYTGFTGFGGIKALVKCLKVFGYKNFSENGPGKRRFAIWSGDQTGREKDIIRATFNSSKNDNSSQIQIIIGSPSIKEGVSLLRVIQVHILEAYWNHSRLEQIYGRAVRFCSHKTLPKDERNVIIYIYAAICKQNKKITPKESIDLYMLEMADKKKEEMAPYVLALQEVAVDRLLFT